MAKVCIVDRESEADYKVCFVSSESSEKHTKLISPAALVDRECDADLTIYITSRESDADILITRSHLKTR